jgi:hypothetical protein
LLCAYSFATSGNNPEWLLEQTPREKMFYLAAISWWSDKNNPQEHK